MNYKFRRALSILVLFFVLAGIHLFFYVQNMTLKYGLTDLKIKLAEQLNKNRVLESQLAAKEDLRLIEKTAKEKLNMIYPEKMHYILISAEACR